MELKDAQDQVQEWRDQAQNLFNTQHREAVAKVVEAMREKELMLISDLGSLQLELNTSKRACKAVADQLETLRVEAKDRAELDDRNRKLERKLVVVQRDRDHYRAMSDMFEKEMTHVGGMNL